MVRTQRRFLAGLVISIPMLVGVAPPVVAQTEDEATTTETSEQKSAAAERRAEALKKLEEKRKELAAKKLALEEKRAAIKERIQGRLDEVKKKVCEQRLTNIKRTMTNAGEVGAKHLTYFDRALARIQDFYTDKGLSVANYDALVAAVASKKAAAQTAVDAVKAGVDFSCDAENPVGLIDDFNSKVRTMHEALKEVRTALKDLLVAVKTAAEAKEGES